MACNRTAFTSTSHPRYRTTWCQFYRRQHHCRYGNSCDHAHTWADYRGTDRPSWGWTDANPGRQENSCDHANTSADYLGTDRGWTPQILPVAPQIPGGEIVPGWPPADPEPWGPADHHLPGVWSARRPDDRDRCGDVRRHDRQPEVPADNGDDADHAPPAGPGTSVIDEFSRHVYDDDEYDIETCDGQEYGYDIETWGPDYETWWGDDETWWSDDVEDDPGHQVPETFHPPARHEPPKRRPEPAETRVRYVLMCSDDVETIQVMSKCVCPEWVTATQALYRYVPGGDEADHPGNEAAQPGTSPLYSERILYSVGEEDGDEAQDGEEAGDEAADEPCGDKADEPGDEAQDEPGLGYFGDRPQLGAHGFYINYFKFKGAGCPSEHRSLK